MSYLKKIAPLLKWAGILAFAVGSYFTYKEAHWFLALLTVGGGCAAYLGKKLGG